MEIPDWLQMLLTIVLTLCLILGLVYIGVQKYKKLKSKGTCSFTSLQEPDPGTSGSYVQTGYINCTGGGSLWIPGVVNVLNKGFGTFYLGPLPGEKSPTELDAKSSVDIEMQASVPVNVFYQSGSSNTTPALTITCI